MMKKNIYMLAAALVTGMMLTACAPKADNKNETADTVESTAAVETGDTEDREETESSEPTGEAGTAVHDETLLKVHEAVKKAYGDNYIPNMPYDETALKEVFQVGPELYDAAIAEGPMISVNVETFIGIKAKEGKAEEVAKALESYKKKQIEEAVQYPMNMVKLEASEVIARGDYVFFLMLGTPDPAEEEKGDKEALESAKKNNQLAVDAVNSVIPQ